MRRREGGGGGRGRGEGRREGGRTVYHISPQYRALALFECMTVVPILGLSRSWVYSYVCVCWHGGEATFTIHMQRGTS